jgi:hypothetical protein
VGKHPCHLPRPTTVATGLIAYDTVTRMGENFRILRNDTVLPLQAIAERLDEDARSTPAFRPHQA